MEQKSRCLHTFQTISLCSRQRQADADSDSTAEPRSPWATPAHEPEVNRPAARSPSPVVDQQTPLEPAQREPEPELIPQRILQQRIFPPPLAELVAPPATVLLAGHVPINATATDLLATVRIF
jgi:hypothetical protein